MGVLGLWQLLSPVGQPVTLESLENKILAVDISIWLNQALKGYRDSQGGSIHNAHLLSLFSRLCKLLFYKIRPIIVFDGGFPELKKQTIINRQQRRIAVKQSSKNIGLEILTNYLASQQLGKLSDISSSSKTTFKGKEKPHDEIFKLPPMPESSQSLLNNSFESNENIGRKFNNFSKEDIKYLNEIDIDSHDFEALPPDVKQEILSNLKESRKHRTWEQFEQLPKESKDFSNYQMQCLLKRRKLQSKLEKVQNDIRKINSSAYVSQYTNDHVIGETNKIMSDDTSYYVLLKKIIGQKESDSDKKAFDEKSSASAMTDTKNAFIKDIENIDVNEDYADTFSIKVKKENFDSVSDAFKNAHFSMNLFDEEYNVDNPPIIIPTKERNLEITNLKTKSSEIQDDLLDLSDEESVVDEQSYINETKDHNENTNQNILYNCDNKNNLIETINVNSESFTDFNIQLYPKNDVGILSQDDTIFKECSQNKSKIYILPKQNNTEILSNVTVTVSNKEVVSCDKEQATNDLLQNNCEKNKLEKYEIHKIKDSTYMENSLFTNNEIYSVNSKPEQNSSPKKQIQAISNEDSAFEPSSILSKQLLSESNQLDKNLQETNIELQRNLEAASAILGEEQAKQDRQAATVQDHMVEECKELLRLFGVPYIVSPLEAEAQCAFYDKVDLTHGTITDDSDVWLFGGKNVYKNFFTQQKFVECYKDKEIFAHFGLSRMKLINFALLTGSDYTEGIEGVGPVTAMEIISEFPGDSIDALQKFKDWWKDSNDHAKPPENKVRAKFKKLILDYNFPNEKVFDAYLNPEVDDSTEKFTWGRPDLDALRDYTKERFGWNQNKVDSALLPVLKKLSEQNKQTHIDSFFTINLRKETNLFPSKRIMSALKKITSPQKGEISKETISKAVKRKVRTKKVVPKKTNKTASTTKSRNANIKYQGPVLSETSSDSEC